MPQSLYDAGPNGHWVFLLVTIVLGGGTAFMSGRAVAETWRPQLHLVVYAVLLALSVRFIHFALFEEPLLSLKNFIVDWLVVFGVASVGYRTARAQQMASQYGWTRRVIQRQEGP